MTKTVTAMSSRTCESCRHYLGSGSCAISMERECGDGQRELWEAPADRETVIIGLRRCLDSMSVCPDDCPYTARCHARVGGASVVFKPLLQDALQALEATR